MAPIQGRARPLALTLLAVIGTALVTSVTGQTTIYAAELATAMRSWGDATTATRSISNSWASSGKPTPSGYGALQLTYASSNFYGLSSFQTTANGCFLTGGRDYDLYWNYPIWGIYFAPSNNVEYFCATATSGCNYLQTFNPALCASDTAAVSFGGSEFKMCNSYYYFRSPAIAYLTNNNPCPYGWNNVAGTPWRFMSAPSVTGNCNSYQWSCTAPGLLFSATSTNADGAVPYFTFSLETLAGSGNLRCITALTLKLTRRDASAGAGCALANYRATMVGLQASWSSATLTYNNMNNYVASGQSVSLGGFSVSGTVLSYSTSGAANANEVLKVINDNIAITNVAGNKLSFGLKLTCSSPASSYQYMWGGNSGNGPNIQVTSIRCANPCSYSSTSAPACTCVNRNQYVDTTTSPQTCKQITCSIPAQDPGNTMSFPSGTLTAGDSTGVAGSCKDGYHASTPRILTCDGLPSAPHTSTNPSGTLVYPTPCESCSTCGVGKFCAGGSCSGCPVDTFTDTTGQTQCASCDSVTGGIGSGGTNGQTGQTSCTCKSGGSETAAGGFYGNGQTGRNLRCTACPSSSYQPGFAGNSASPTFCRCLKNYYSIDGTTANGACTQCPTGGVTSAGGSTTCTCAAGGSPSVGGGYFSNGLTGSQLICTSCPANSYQPTSGATTCKCMAGYYSNGGSGASLVCTPCPIGKYKESGAVVETSCSSCPAGQDTSSDGTGQDGEAASSASMCKQCAVGYFQTTPGTACQAAPVNTYTITTGTGNTGVLPCPAGTSTNTLTARSRPSDCLFCQGGYFSEQQSDCQACPVNTFSTVGSPTCSSCDAGSDTRSQTAQGHCSLCAVNTYSPGNGQSCSKCSAGTSTNSASGASFCTDCSAGFYSEEGGNCTRCPEGQYAPSGSPQCSVCPAGSSTSNGEYCTCNDGFASNGGSGAALVCTKCASGHYVQGQRREATTCTPCPVNTYCPDGAAFPLPCPANSNADEAEALCTCRPGYYATIDGTVLTCSACTNGTYNPGGENLEACLPCPPGSESGPAATKCLCSPGFEPAGEGCSPCTPGTYSPSGSKCLPCPANWYCPEHNQTAALRCPADGVSEEGSAVCSCKGGYWSDTGAALEDGDCSICPENTFSAPGSTNCTQCPDNSESAPGSAVCSCVAGSAVQDGECELCEPGSYSATGAQCVPCPANTFAGDDGATGCDPCSAFATSPLGSAHCTCKAGYQQTTEDGSVCVACGVGEYNAVPGSATCQPCPAGANSTGAATTCKCLDGYTTAGTGALLTCTACPGGWVATAGATTCTQCPAGFYSDPAFPSATCTPCPDGSTSTAGAETCTCRNGYATSGFGKTLVCSACQPGSSAQSGAEACTGCAAGTFQSAPAQATCELCPAGFYGTKANATSFADCAFCPTGTYQPEAGKATCITCGAGTYSTGLGQTSASTCKACPAGQYQDDEGQATCKACGTNTYSAGGASGCSACQAGSSSAGSAAFCTCNAGYYSVTGGSTTEPCTQCPANSTSSAGSTKCACTAGHYSEDGFAGVDGCPVCPANTYSEFDGSGSTRCVPCADGYTTEGETGKSRADQCKACPRGNYRSSAMAACELCPKNTYSSIVGSGSCAPCPAGTHVDALGSQSIFACQLCPPGSASTGGQDCAVCPVNTMANLGTSSGSTACVACPNNTDTRGFSNSTQCLTCPAGQATTGPKTPCTNCPAGYYSSGGSSCQECGANTFSGVGQASCTSCPAGTHTDGATGQTSIDACIACAAGHFSPGGGEPCQPCPINTYANDSTVCVECPGGTSTGGLDGQSSKGSCKPCDNGYVSVAGGSCTACPAGKYASPSADACLPCAQGTYSDSAASQSCKACPTSTNTTSAGATSVTACVCKAGFFGTITSASDKCTACAGNCDENALCPGGATCGGCKAGFVGSGEKFTCVPSMSKIATVDRTLPSASCPGVPRTNATSCSACSNYGASTSLTGATVTTCVVAANSPCCNFPVFYMDYVNTTAVRYPLLEFRAVPENEPNLARQCLRSLRLTFHASNGTFACSGALVHTIETLPATWDPVAVTWATVPAAVDTIVLNGTGYSVGPGSERYLDITAADDLDRLNRNLLANQGVLSIAVKRTCSTGSTLQSTLYHGLAFEGSRTPAGVSYATLGPAQSATFATCHPNAVCAGGSCQCAAGFVGDGVTKCERCEDKCADKIMCLGGESCGTTCIPGYAYNGTACVPSEVKIATVRQSKPTAACVGTQTYGDSTSALSCGECASGPSNATQLCGTSRGLTTACCYEPVYELAANPHSASTPNATTVTAFAFMSFDAVPAADATKNFCLTELQLNAPDREAPACTTSFFQLGLLDDGAWESDLTWEDAGDITPTASLAFTAARLGDYHPSSADLDKLSTNVKANGGRLSFFVKRWCASASLSVRNIGNDDNAHRADSVRVASAPYVVCDANAQCENAACKCKENYYGLGTQCQPITCTGSPVPGYSFDVTEVVQAGQQQTAPCPAGYTGQYVRTCSANGNNPTGTFSAPVDECVPITCAAAEAFNAKFNGGTRVGESSGTCVAGYAGAISRTCTLVDGAGVWSAPSGSCTQIKCLAQPNAGHASWPEVAAQAAAFTVDGTCHDGYRAATGVVPRRECLPTGLYGEITTGCVRIMCEAEDDYEHASWPATVGGQPATGTCAAGYRGAPLRTCGDSGQWETAVANPCELIQCPAVTVGGSVFTATAGGATGTGSCALGYELATGGEAPQRQCGADGTWSGDVTNACVPKTCKAGDANDGTATWTDAPAGSPATIVTGTCNAGYYARYGAPYRGCNVDGEWQLVQNPCERVVCAATTEANAEWAATDAGEAATGVCAEGYYGAPTRGCTAGAGDTVGTWGAVQGSCTQATCAAETVDNAAFEETPTGMVAEGKCIDGTFGQPRRECVLSGTTGAWSATILNPCSATVKCPALESDGHAQWPQADEGDHDVIGNCDEANGWAGNPTRNCGVEGWEPISGSCQLRVCAATNADNAVFGSANAGATVDGTCAENYGTGSGASPQRTCDVATGLYSPPSPSCVRLSCATETTDDGIEWAETLAGETATYACPAGFDGSITRKCAGNGRWLAPSGACTQRQCAATEDATSTWPTAKAGTDDVVGLCKEGFSTGNASPPTRRCQNSGNYGSISNPCTRLRCPAITFGNAQFPSAASGELATGTCVSGYVSSAAATMQCLPTGSWSFDVTNACEQRQCPNGVTQANARWPDNTVAGQTVAGPFCLPGYSGFVSRDCLADGKWSETITGSCSKIQCPERHEDDATWRTTDTSTTPVDVSGICDEGYTGGPTRQCNPDRSWGEITGTCELETCPLLENDQNATWFPVGLGQTATGRCLGNLIGAPKRQCGTDKQWGPITGQCEEPPTPCPATTCGDGRLSAWPTTLPSGSATGTCCPFYTKAAGTAGPSRTCGSDSLWGDIVNDCVLNLVGPDGDRVRGLTAANVRNAATPAVRLTWESTSRDANRFKIYMTSDGLTLEPLVAQYITTTSYTVTGLPEQSAFTFVVVAGDDTNKYDDVGATVSITTSINAPLVDTETALLNATRTSIPIKWNYNSLYTTAFSIEGIILGGGKRALNIQNYTELLPMQPPSNETDQVFVVTDLEPGTTYRFRVWAYNADLLPSSYFELTASTRSASDNAFVPNPGDIVAPIGVVVGVAVAVVLLVVGLIVGFMVYRRRTMAEQRKLLEEYSSQLQMLTLSRGGVLPNSFMGDTMSADALKANLVVPRTSFTGVDATLLNTVMEVALPGFLVMDYSADLRPEARLTAGGAGTIFRGVLLNPEAIHRNNGTEICAIKEVMDWPSLSDEDNAERFHQEVSVMWSLAFHPNIIKLLGYTESPRTIVTRLYPTDLFRYLLAQDDKAPLESFLLLHICSGMVAAVAAAHSMGIAQRDIMLPNCCWSCDCSGTVRRMRVHPA